MENQPITYTAALARVEEIVASLESGACDIDQLCERIAEAKRLLAFCTKRLEDVDAQYELLMKSDDGQG